MLPVGIRNASMTNARKTNARMKAVISHSKVLATSATRSFFLTTVFFLSVLSVRFSVIHFRPVHRRVPANSWMATTAQSIPRLRHGVRPSYHKGLIMPPGTLTVNGWKNFDRKCLLHRSLYCIVICRSSSLLFRWHCIRLLWDCTAGQPLKMASVGMALVF